MNGQASAMLVTISAFLDDRFPLWRTPLGRLPEGLRIEMHPAVRSMILREEGNWPPAAEMLGVPVKVTTDLPNGTWRLAVVTEKVLLGGTLKPNPYRVGACPECGSYRTDGRSPYLHKPGCSKEGDPQAERWLAEEAAGDHGGPTIYGEDCQDCGTKPGTPHDDGCDVARCLQTGLQRLSCCEDHDHGEDMWTGRWPGEAECEEFGWYSVFTSHGWVRCDRDERGASPDLNRLHLESAWDRDQLRWVRL